MRLIMAAGGCSGVRKRKSLIPERPNAVLVLGQEVSRMAWLRTADKPQGLEGPNTAGNDRSAVLICYVGDFRKSVRLKAEGHIPHVCCPQSPPTHL